MQFKLYAIVLLALITFSYQQCGANGVDHFGVCLCHSGYSGSTCGTFAGGGCTFNTLSPLKSDFLPTLHFPDTTFNNDNFVVSIRSPLVTGRLETRAYVNDPNNNKCAYPGQHFTKGINSTGACADTFTATIPWSDAKTCGWDLATSTTSYVYTGNLFVRQREQLPAIRGYTPFRNVTTIFPLKLTFQRQIDVSYSIKGYAAVNLLAVLTSQQYNPSPTNIKVEFITQFQYPFEINTAVAYSYPASPVGLTPVVALAGDSPSCVANQPCLQKWVLTITPGNGVCTFTGVYSVRFTLKCHTSITDTKDCPLPSLSSTTADVSLDLNSENFCTKLEVDINLTGSLLSYEESTYATRKDAFLVDKVAYFKVAINTPKFTLTETKINRIQVTYGTTTRTLYDSYTVQTVGTSVQLSVDAASAYSTGFNFKFVPAVFAEIATDSSQTYTVAAQVNVKYTAIDGTVQQKLMKVTFSNNDISQIKDGLSGEVSEKYTKTVTVISSVSSGERNACGLLFVVLVAIIPIFF